MASKFYSGRLWSYNEIIPVKFSAGQGRSIFYPTLNADEAVLKAAQYADQAGLWIGNKAKVSVLNTNIGTLGNGAPTNVINVYRNSNGFIHGSPGTIR